MYFYNEIRKEIWGYLITCTLTVQSVLHSYVQCTKFEIYYQSIRSETHKLAQNVFAKASFLQCMSSIPFWKA